jgi:hypothetical protein
MLFYALSITFMGRNRPKSNSPISKRPPGFLDALEKFPLAILADLNDPLTMPPSPSALDRAVDAYACRPTLRPRPKRVASLFERYQQLTSPLAASCR